MSAVKSGARPIWLIVFLKELKETLRDRRALGLLLLFTVMYPAMLGYMLQQQINRAVAPEREGMDIAVIGHQHVPTLMAQFKQRNINVKPKPEMDEEAIASLLRERKLVALVRVDAKYVENYQAMHPGRIELWIDSGANDNRIWEVEEVIQSYGGNVGGARLLAHGVSPAVVNPVRLQRYDIGGTAARSAGLIGAILGFLFFPAFICGLSAAVDSTAGERERRSLEVLMAQPASPWMLVGGKWIAAGSLAIFGITLELALAHAILSWLPLEEIGMSWSVTSLDLALVSIATIPLSLLAAGLHIALAMNAKSFKEAQSVLSFVVLLPMLPGVIVSMLELKTAMWMYLVPMLSNQTLLRELAKGQEIVALPYVFTFLSSMVPALAAVAFASWRMKSERYVLAV